MNINSIADGCYIVGEPQYMDIDYVKQPKDSDFKVFDAVNIDNIDPKFVIKFACKHGNNYTFHKRNVLDLYEIILDNAQPIIVDKEEMIFGTNTNKSVDPILKFPFTRKQVSTILAKRSEGFCLSEIIKKFINEYNDNNIADAINYIKRNNLDLHTIILYIIHCARKTQKNTNLILTLLKSMNPKDISQYYILYILELKLPKLIVNYLYYDVLKPRFNNKVELLYGAMNNIRGLNIFDLIHLHYGLQVEKEYEAPLGGYKGPLYFKNIIRAIDSNNIVLIENFIINGLSPYIVIKNLYHLVDYAIISGKVDMVNMMLDQYGKPVYKRHYNYDDTNFLYYALLSGDLDMYDTIIKRGVTTLSESDKNKRPTLINMYKIHQNTILFERAVLKLGVKMTVRDSENKNIFEYAKNNRLFLSFLNDLFKKSTPSNMPQLPPPPTR